MSDIRNTESVQGPAHPGRGGGAPASGPSVSHEVPLFDPFLLLDDFRSGNPDDYIKGFPWHPHRGIETITYMLDGEVEHGDSMGNRGVIGPGDVQWMTAGSGIIHQEMPQGDAERPDGRLPAVGQPARRPQDDGPALPGREERRHPGGQPEERGNIRIICGEVVGRGTGSTTLSSTRNTSTSPSRATRNSSTP